MSLKSPDKEDDLSGKVNDAITRGDITELLALLESQKVDVDARDESHGLTTVLMKVCYMNIENEAQFAILDIVEDLEVDTDVRDASGRTAVMHSCIAEKANIFNFLLSLRCDMTLVDNGGNSVLIYAIKSGNVKLLESVLEHDSAVDLIKKKNNIGQVPLDIARQTNNAKVTNIVEGFQQSVFDSEKLLKRKRSKRRSHKLPPTSYSTASKPLTSRATTNQQTTVTSQQGMESVTTPRVKSTPRIPIPTPRPALTTPRVSMTSRVTAMTPRVPAMDLAMTPRVPPMTSRLLTNRERNETKVYYHDVLSNKDIFKETSSIDSAIESMSQSPQFDRSACRATRDDVTNDVTSRGVDVTNDVTSRGGGDETSNYTNSKPSYTFPQIKITAPQDPKKDGKKCRRNSVSLPDLRSLRGNLITSGDVTPASAEGLCNRPFNGQSKESLAGSDDVFVAAGKENRRESVLTDLPKLGDISKHKNRDDFRRVGKAKTKYASDEALYRSLIS